MARSDRLVQGHGQRATELSRLLQAEGYSPVIILLSKFEDGGTLYYRVWVGEFRERDGAERLQRQLQRNGGPLRLRIAGSGQQSLVPLDL